MYVPKFYPSRQPADFAAYRAHLKANLREPGRIEALKAMMTSSNAVEAFLNRVAVPTLVVMGTKDPDFKNPAAEAQWIADQVRGTVLMVEGAGHYPHAEMPERVGPAIVRFLAEGQSNHVSGGGQEQPCRVVG
jgi:pimeloyl-ACP methyl ester carboxylesterase